MASRGCADYRPPERLARFQAAGGRHATGTLTDLGNGRTKVVIHQRHVPEPMRSPDAPATSLDKLEEHLARLIREERP
jgi:hypothetical protein